MSPNPGSGSHQEAPVTGPLFCLSLYCGKPFGDKGDRGERVAPEALWNLRYQKTARKERS